MWQTALSSVASSYMLWWLMPPQWHPSHTECRRSLAAHRSCTQVRKDFKVLVLNVRYLNYNHLRHWICLFSPSSAGSGASTYTLDSGIGTFPLPDCSSGAAGRGPSKTRAGVEHHSSGSPGRAGRRARTLERDLTSQEECYVPHKQLIPTIQYGAMLEGRSSAGVIREGENKLTTWTQ